MNRNQIPKREHIESNEGGRNGVAYLPPIPRWCVGTPCVRPSSPTRKDLRP
jgi:hypothetical protein